MAHVGFAEETFQLLGFGEREELARSGMEGLDDAGWNAVILTDYLRSVDK